MLTWHWEIIVARSYLMKFDDKLNDVKINRNTGITNTLKNYVIVSSDKSVIMRNAGWNRQTTAARYFNFCVPFYCLDFAKITNEWWSTLIISWF